MSKHTIMGQQSEDENESILYDTLSSVKSSASDKSAGSRIRYNYSSTKELLSHVSKHHLKKHRENHYKKLTCHKLTYKTVSYAYHASAKNLSINKLYSLLYLAVLINGDILVLADILRFIKEGHLSFNTYSHFFPENYFAHNIWFGKIQRRHDFVGKSMQKTVLGLAKYLNISRYILQPDLLALCERYCKELNLPDDVCQFAKNMLVLFSPKMALTTGSRSLPSYEARVLSVIIVVLKLLFGLDDQSEIRISEHVNSFKKCGDSSELFDILEWLKYIQYRRLILMEYHFPMQFDNNRSLQEPTPFLNFSQMRDVSHDQLLHKVSEKFKVLLSILKDNGVKSKTKVNFPPTLTPYSDYIKIIVDELVKHETNYQENILSQCFVNQNVSFISSGTVANKSTEPTKHISHRVHYNTRIDPALPFENRHNQKTLVNLNMTETDLMENINTGSFEGENRLVKTLRKRRKRKKEIEVNTDCDKIINVKFDTLRSIYESHDGDNKLLYPCKRYWLKYKYNCNSKRDFDKFQKQLPVSFRIILKEFSMICEQHIKDFFNEFQLTEAYFLHHLGLVETGELVDTVLENIIKQSKTNW